MGEIWIDALDFTDRGGWKEDTQFVHLMGSGYLLAADEPGVPVRDATIQIDVPEQGKYRVWVRDRNWLRWHSPGKFNLVINGKNNNRLLGAMPSDAWIWEIAGDYELDKGLCTISLHDLTGYFSRCASILLTTDLDYTPSREVGWIHKERARIKGLDVREKAGGDYGVIVVGGGPAGVPAAIASAREGVKTLLIQDRQMLGGNGSPEVGLTFDGAAADHIYARETGIAEEIRRLRDADPDYYGDWSRAMKKIADAEKNLTVAYNQHVCSVEMADDKTIRSVSTIDIRTLEQWRYSGTIFVDCTGDAWVGYYAGARYHCGRESRDEYGESIAPESADTLTMSGCIKSGNISFFTDTGMPVAYHAPEWVPELPKSDEEFGRAISGKGASLLWWLEAPNDYDDMWDGEETRDALLLVILGYYDHVKNYWSGKKRIQNYRLNFSGVFNGRRESRRLIGDYVLTQDDCLSGRQFEDAVAYSGWTLDVHHPKGIYSGKEGPSFCGKHVPLTTVPFRCLYSKNIDNLLFAGRNVSATHIAIGTLRVQNTIVTLGQAAGTAAAMCIKLHENPRGIYQRHIRELQQLLIKNDQYIPGVKNEDPEDPCLTASVAASSFSRIEHYNTLRGTEADLLPMDRRRMAVFNALREDGDIKKVWLKLYSSHSKPYPVTLHSDNKVGSKWGVYRFHDAASTEVLVPPGENWVEFPVDIRVGENNAYSRCAVYVRVDPAEGIFWRSLENLSFYEQREEETAEGKWIIQSAVSMCATSKEPLLSFADCRPQNVINGYSRIVDAEHYEWVSDPEQGMPQWIDLEFQEPTTINEISVVFDTDLTNPGTCWTVKRPGVPVCVKDYDIAVFADNQWSTIAKEQGNFMRRRIHSFRQTKVDKLRVTVYATWGDKCARITEIRASRRGR